MDKGWIPGNSTLSEVCYGVEVVNTTGAQETFNVTNFSVDASSLPPPAARRRRCRLGSVTMDIGFGAPVSGAWATPRNLAELGRRAERLGYRYAVDVPAAARSPPGPRNLAPMYHPRCSTRWCRSATLAAATSSIRLGVATVSHPFASPLLLAKQAATVDVLSGGRLDLGIGLRLAGRGIHRVRCAR